MQFETLELHHREKIEACRRGAGHTASSHAFSSLFLWRNEKSYTVSFIKNAFVVKDRDGYFFPCGDRESVAAALREILFDEPFASFRYAREEDAALARSLYADRVTVTFDAASREYLYDRIEQIEMKGKRFQYQRAKCNKARRLGEVVSKPLTAKNACDAIRITNAWAEKREDRGDADLTLEAIGYLETLSLLGNVLYLDGEAIGFDLGAMIAPDTLDNHIAKTLRDDVDALMKLLWYESLPDTVKVINREEDLGIRGLRIHKEDAQPIGYNDTYTLSFGV